tara:strand:- start:1420 stop:1707 length:288 start_codon:yes stop_codon:yes gene_type:complete
VGVALGGDNSKRNRLQHGGGEKGGSGGNNGGEGRNDEKDDGLRQGGRSAPPIAAPILLSALDYRADSLPIDPSWWHTEGTISKDALMLLTQLSGD